MDVIKYTRPRTLGDLIAVEYDANYCRDSVTYLAGSGSVRVISQFMVLGEINTGAQTVASSAKAGNTGNGVLGSLTADAGAPEGAYSVLFVEPASNAGAFAVFRPDGTLDGEGAVGAAYNGSVNFTIADGATDFVSGDAFTVTVAYADGSKHVQVDATATNGAQYAGGIAVHNVNVPDGTDAPGSALKRGPLIVRAEELVWPANVTAAQKHTWTQQLQARGILVRTSG